MKKPSKFVFECQRDGRCCEERESINVYVEDIERWSKDGTVYKIFPDLSIEDIGTGMPTKITIKKTKIKGGSGFACPLLDMKTKACTIYSNRPISCIAYPLGFNGVNYVLKDENCPGLNKGEMTRERLKEMRDAAKKEHEAILQMRGTLPALYGLFMKLMTEQSEKALGRLSKEDRERLNEILKSASERAEDSKNR